MCVCVCVARGGVPLWSSRNKKGGVGVTPSASDPTTGSWGGGREREGGRGGGGGGLEKRAGGFFSEESLTL